MDEIKKQEIILTISRANSILINGKKPTKSFIKQIPLENIYSTENEIAFHVGWINLTFDSSALLNSWWRVLPSPSKMVTLLYVTMDKELKRTYISTIDLKDIEDKEGNINQIYI